MYRSMVVCNILQKDYHKLSVVVVGYIESTRMQVPKIYYETYASLISAINPKRGVVNK